MADAHASLTAAIFLEPRKPPRLLARRIDRRRRPRRRAIDLVEPGEVWGDRVNEVNLRFAKILRFGGTRTHVGIDVFNLLNSDAILTYNQTFTPGGAWLAPQSVLTPRFMKVSAQIDF